ncbi:MAG: arginine--tRNA ligase [Candidatus Omnitrophica bacterium]|nr:arginine--tRNA ligase [Candidatus Omnitrophota bacterium]
MFHKKKNHIISIILESAKAIAQPALGPSASDIYLETPKDKTHGDLSTNIAFRIAKTFKKSPYMTAESIVEEAKKRLNSHPASSVIDRLEACKPGFINLWFRDTFLHETLKEVHKEGAKYGSSRIGQKKKLQIEFVSANPTGPLTIAHGRQAAVGDALARLLEFSGFRVTREYYLNNEGLQIRLLGDSIRARYMEALDKGSESDFPKDGYKGDYIVDLARGFARKYKNKYTEDKFKSSEIFSEYGLNAILKEIKKDLHSFGVHFDVWSSQKALRKSGKIEKALRILEEKGLLYDADGARWFASTKLGDDKDRVVVRSSGELTYLAPDIAYHMEKRNRGFKRIIDIWGPDHHGYIGRLKAATKALGYEDGQLDILISQLVTLYQKGEPISMSTRAGKFVTLRQVMEEVGKDACRFFFIMRKTDSHLDFDLELAKKQSPENPVYYIQYAHARISSIIEYAKKELKGKRSSKADPALLKEAEEIDLLKSISQFPMVVASSAMALEPYRLIPYLMDLAKTFHSFYTKHRVAVSQEPSLSKARLLLVEGVRMVIANGLSLLGVTAPIKM